MKLPVTGTVFEFLIDDNYLYCQYMGEAPTWPGHYAIRKLAGKHVQPMGDANLRELVNEPEISVIAVFPRSLERSTSRGLFPVPVNWFYPPFVIAPAAQDRRRWSITDGPTSRISIEEFSQRYPNLDPGQLPTTGMPTSLEFALYSDTSYNAEAWPSRRTNDSSKGAE